MWTTILSALLSHLGLSSLLSALLSQTNASQILAWVVQNLEFVGKTFVKDVIAARADNPDLMTFLHQRIVFEEASFPDKSGFQRLADIVTGKETWDYIKAIGLDIQGSLLATMVSEYHHALEPVLPDLSSVWLATGVMPSTAAITQMIDQKVVAQPPLPIVTKP